MDDTDRIIGELKQFQRYTEKELQDINSKVEELLLFRWKAAGFLAACFAMAEMAHWIIK